MMSDSLELIAATRRGAERAWRDGYTYIKAGIIRHDLVATDLRTRTLFEEDGAKRARLMGALDDVEERCGRWRRSVAARAGAPE